MNIINNSINLLKQWPNKNTFNIIFDSDIDGDGWNEVLRNKIFNKSNLYFIHFNGNSNVYGGCLNITINGFSGYIYARNSFVFSLIRNGKVNSKRYFLKQCKNRAFWLYNNDLNGLLYVFGKDIFVYKVGINQSYCTNNDNKDFFYECNNNNKTFTDITY